MTIPGRGGLPPRRVDQQYAPPSPGIPPGSAAGILRALELIIFGTGANRGVFVYNGTPAFGTLTESVAAVANTDSFNNAYLPGFTSYTNLGGGVWVANNISAANQLAWFTAAGPAGPWTQIASITANTNGDLTIVSGNRIGAGNPLVAFISGAFETWHTLGGLGVTGYTINFGRFRYEAIGPGYAVYDIELLAGAGGGTAGVYTWTIIPGAAYQFAGATSRSYPLGFNGVLAAGANAGSVLIDGAGAGTPGRVRIDIPGLPAGTVIGGTIWVPLS